MAVMTKLDMIYPYIKTISSVYPNTKPIGVLLGSLKVDFIAHLIFVMSVIDIDIT